MDFKNPTDNLNEWQVSPLIIQIISIFFPLFFNDLKFCASGAFF